MTKMKLEVSALEVQSFEVAAGRGLGTGTVNGHAAATANCGTNHDHCPSVDCSLFRTCDTNAPCEPPASVYVEC